MSELVKRGHDQAAELKSSCGAVDVREVAQLISDLATQLDCTALALRVRYDENGKLTAENAGLKSIQAWAVADVFKSGAKRFESTKAAGFDTDDCLHDAVLVMLSELKIPATDAFLAEVRARAIDSLVDIKTKQLADMHPDTHAFGATAMSIRSQINELQMFAAQLRQEAAQ
ncbi:hypothetical protein [Enterobacter asburiae]|uniref:hypothetical protein n=1 Tax=Enterobacter asburiae TaxID=61645 RepID=UPI002074E508|nr:hypothetical protein [Enterobacter asburiae]